MPYELTPQDRDAISDYPDSVMDKPKFPPPGCPCNKYVNCKECLAAHSLIRYGMGGSIKSTCAPPEGE
jgi:hypothetical protein